MNEKSSSAYLEALRVEHRELGQLIHSVEVALAAAALQGWKGPNTTQVVCELCAPRDYMREHFAQEEEGGYLEEAISHAPRLGPQAALLEYQHPQLLAKFSDLCEQAQGLCDDPAAWRTLHEGARRSIKELLTHEAAENQLVTQAFNVDLGLAD